MADDKKKMTVGDCLGNEGQLPTIPWGQKAVKVYRNCPEVVTHMELMVAVAARENLKKLEPIYRPDEYAAKTKELDNALLFNHHGFGGPLFMAALGSQDAAAMMLAACVQPGEPGYTVDDAKRSIAADTVKVMDALVVALPSFFSEGAKSRGMDPEAVAPLVNQMVGEYQKAAKRVGKSSRK